MKLLINEGFVDYYFVLLLMFVFKQKFDYIKGKNPLKYDNVFIHLIKTQPFPEL